MMDKRLIHEAHIDGLGEIYYVKAPFDVALRLFKENHLDLISARDLAFARIHVHPVPIEAAQHSLSRNGSYVKGGIIYLPGWADKIELVEDSVVLSFVLLNSYDAVRAHILHSEFSAPYMDDHWRHNCGKEKTFSLKDLNPVSTNRFAKDERTRFIFQDIAGDYGLYLYRNGIGAMPFAFNSEDYISSHYRGGPYANQLWLTGLGNDSQVGDSGRNLHYNLRVRGVQRKTAEGGSQKTSLEGLVGKGTDAGNGVIVVRKDQISTEEYDMLVSK